MGSSEIIMGGLVAVMLLLFVVELFFVLDAKKQQEQIRKNIYSRQFITAKEFNDNWINKGTFSNYGYKYADTPGCYIILIFNSPVLDGNYSGYANGYIGQSKTVCSRVHNHLNGKGNGDIYADIKNGKYVYLQIVDCAESELDNMEIGLIASFDYNRLYNKTKGGAHKRGDNGVGPLTYKKIEEATAAVSTNKVHNVSQDCFEQSYSDRFLSYGGLDKYRHAVSLEFGIGIVKNETEAVKYHQAAIIDGNTDSMVHLALMLIEGRGVTPDKGRAIKLLSTASGMGNKRAQIILNNLR